MVKGLISGEVDFQLTAVTFAHTFAPTGQVRVLAVMGNQRMKDMANVPTIAEAGFNVSPFSYWSGYAAHANTPTQIVDRLHKDLSVAALSPFVRERLGNIGLNPQVNQNTQEFRKMITDEVNWSMEYSKGLNLDKM
jgi:tripartite-type tricarboxylate transporter receptor subunit TctC